MNGLGFSLRHWRYFACIALLAMPAAAHARTSSNLVPEWVAADLDGDRRLDLVSAGPARHEGRGYIQEISLRFSSLDGFRLSVRTPMAPQRLVARDLDGDSRRDLVLEGLDHRPLAVLLNDGEGRFHLGSADEFKPRSSRGDSRSFDSAEDASQDLDNGECPRDDAGSLPLVEAVPDLTITALAPRSYSAHAAFSRACPSSRGPPRSF